MTAEDRLREAAAIGDELVKLVERYAPGSDQDAAETRERWRSSMAGCQRANLIDAPAAPEGDEEWGS